MERILINHTNHPFIAWSDDQLKASKLFGKILDIPFPEIDPEWDEEQIERLAQENCKKIVKLRPVAVLCQGEFTYCYSLINLLKAKGIVVLAACSKRETKEWIEGGKNVKKTIFSFVRFRVY